MKRSSGSAVQVSRRKAMGAHYTPPVLARFVAERLVPHVRQPSDGVLRILDPACGDGALLEAFLKCVGDAGIVRCEACGVEADEAALAAARSRVARFTQARPCFIHGDFLDISRRDQRRLDFGDAVPSSMGLDGAFDVIIANPPYVRTQVLGAARSQRLAARFGLSGRVDLYHAFLVAATEALRPGGMMGIITSNRFLTTLSGSAIRSYLARQYEIEEVIDLGDTKLFEAAVLPAIFIGRRMKPIAPRQARPPARFMKVYSQPKASQEQAGGTLANAGILEILGRGKPGRYRLPEGVSNVACGRLALNPDPSRVWSLTTAGEAAWLRRVRAGAGGVFGDLAAVRVGIKTTADEVFIRSDWDALPLKIRPEPELLRPLLRHEDARRWVLPAGAEPAARILYPHEVSGGRRTAVDLRRYPKAKAYLESYKQRLERRQYVIDAGRQWYEIWVPQDPDAWKAPKIVVPDISAEPRFYVDWEGRLVDGDCYWITPLSGAHPDTIFLLLGVANSSLMTRFHDLAFNNKLYASRRRYITQYVANYPYPALDAPASRRLIAGVKRIVETLRADVDSARLSKIEGRLDELVYEAFGVNSPLAAPNPVRRLSC